jgi:hypothetical protein
MPATQGNAAQPQGAPPAVSSAEFPAYMNKLFNQIRSDGLTEKTQRVRKWVRNDKFYQGQQLGYISPITGRWIDIDPDVLDDDDDEPLFVNNQFRYHVKSLRKEGTRSQTRLHARARSDRTDKIGAAEFATALIEYYQRTGWTEQQRQTELMNMLLYGNYFRLVYYSTDVLGGVARIPLTKTVTVKPAPDSYYCPDCDTSGSAEGLHTGEGVTQPDDGSVSDGTGLDTEDPQMPCLNCGSPNTQITQVPSFQSEVPTGDYQEIKVGDIFTEVVNPMEVHVHLHARNIRQTPYIHRERDVMRCTLKSKFPNASLKSSAGRDSNGNPVNAMMRQLESSAGNLTGFEASRSTPVDAGSPFEMLSFEQLWLDPAVYADYVTPKDFQTSLGDFFPMGTRLSDVAPSGLYVARVGDEILDLREEDKNLHWSHGVFDLIPSRFFGDGLEDMVELQRQLNEVISLRFENMMANAAPATIFNPLKIDANQFSGKPREMSPLQNATPDDDIRKFVMRLDGAGLDRENFAAEENYKKDMQVLSGAFSVMSGMPDVDVHTATGMQIVRDAAVSALGPALAIRAGVDVEWSNQVLKLAQKHWTEERFIPFQGKYDASCGTWFSAADVDADFEITAEAGSWMPRTEMETRANLAGFVSPESTGLPLGFLNPQVPADIRQFAAEQYRIPVGLDSDRVQARIAQVRIEKLISMEKLLVQNGLIAPDMPAPVEADPITDAQNLAGSQQPAQAAPQVEPDSNVPAPDAPPADSPAPEASPATTQPAPQPIQTPFSALAATISQQIPVKVLVDEHEVFIKFYRDWLTTNDGQAASPLVQHVVEMLIARHFFAKGQLDSYLQSLMPMPEMQGLPPQQGVQPAHSQSSPSPSGNPQKPPQNAPSGQPQGYGTERPQSSNPKAQMPTPQSATV